MGQTFLSAKPFSGRQECLPHANLRPGKLAVFGLSAANWQTSVGSPVAAVFHAALGYTWLYYTSTFPNDYWQHSVVLSQVIDPAAITQNEIDVTSIDGSREITLWFRELSHAEAQRRREERPTSMAESDAEQAVRIANSILDGSTSVFLGCKQLVGLLHRLGIDRDEPYVTIVGVESETDHLPILPQDRMHWNKEVLASKDAELAAYLPRIEASVMDACRAIIARYSES